ncbi:MAG: hypothetical protein QXN62_08210 [Candidatus Bathyarchaeia archaeon]
MKIISEHYVRGIIPKLECKIDVRVSWVVGKIVDEQGNSTPEMSFRSYLASVDNVHIIIGFRDLLEKFHVEFNATSKEAFIETA